MLLAIKLGQRTEDDTANRQIEAHANGIRCYKNIRSVVAHSCVKWDMLVDACLQSRTLRC